MRFLLVMLAACGAAQKPPRPTGGTIAGLARDHDSGELIAEADIRVTGPARGATTTTHDGSYHLDHVRAGQYRLVAEYAGQTVTVDHVDVKEGGRAVVDLTFTLGQPAPIALDYEAQSDTSIDHYRPRDLTTTTARIEGTINDSRTGERVAGAVITASRGAAEAAEDVVQTVSDDQGRYRFDAVPPATYTVSAFYSIGGRGSIEVRRSEIAVAGGEAVVVPLWVELSKRN